MKNETRRDIIPALPNSFPYNELLLSGKLSSKTRTWKWNHVGLTLLYTSTSTAREVAAIHRLDPKNTQRCILVGVGELLPVKEIGTFQKATKLEKEFANHKEGYHPIIVDPSDYCYKFKNLKRFKEPIPFKAPRGAVRTFNVPISVVAEALKEIGISL